METVFLSLTRSDLQDLIAETVNSCLKRNHTSQIPSTETDCWFDLNELCNYLPEKPAKPTVYGWVHSSIIPFHKRAKKLFFLKSEIDLWLKTGRRKTLAEIAGEADSYLTTKKKGGSKP
jgi:hypothetical protein